MIGDRKICVVVPCHNEEENVLSVIESIPDYVDQVVVVDDGSTDRTADLVSGVKDQRVSLIRHESNLGVGAAIISGHRRAMELGADLSAVMAGDGQMDPKFLSGLLSAIIDEGYDYSKGNRFLKSGDLRGMPRYRVAGNLLLTFMTKFASGYWNIFDPQNGYTSVRISTLKEIDLEHLDKGYNFENDMLIHLNIIGASVRDVPCATRYDRAKSGIRPLPFLFRSVFFLAKRSVYRIVRKYVFYDFGPYPILFFPGLILFILGLWYGSEVLYLRYLSPLRQTASTGTILLGAIGLVMGLQLLLTAFIFEVLQLPKPRAHIEDRR